MIKNGIVAGLKPEEIRDMIPKDAWLVFEGWNDAHSPPKAGADAITAQQYQDLVRQVDGDERGTA
jgi:hypothetical protein